jgi:hypothetical protein
MEARRDRIRDIIEVDILRPRPRQRSLFELNGQAALLGEPV